MAVTDAAPIVTTRFGHDDGHTLERYVATGGYQALPGRPRPHPQRRCTRR